MAKRLTKKPKKAAQAQPTGSEMASFLAGILILMLSLGLLGNEGRALCWRVKAKCFYTEGVARVEKTAVIRDEGEFEVEITYHVERNGRKYESVSRIEQDDGAASDEVSAENRRLKYNVGQLYPCWYSLRDPGQASELTPDGLEISKPIKRLWIPGIVFASGYLLCRWPWRRWKARGLLAELPGRFTSSSSFCS